MRINSALRHDARLQAPGPSAGQATRAHTLTAERLMLAAGPVQHALACVRRSIGRR